jgi:23S rRNA (pseudouridine1915-N3)-methyltransferase
MRVWIAAVGAKPRAAFEEPARMYLDRIAPYLSGVEAPVFKSEDALWAAIEKERARTSPLVVLLDERGKPMGSEPFAQWLGRERDAGRQLAIFAVGPPDGWGKQGPGNREKGIDTPRTGNRADAVGRKAVSQRTATAGGIGDVVRLSLGAMTMAHELARVVLCEQVYRALTILAGHPYHRV